MVFEEVMIFSGWIPGCDVVKEGGKLRRGLVYLYFCYGIVCLFEIRRIFLGILYLE